MPLRDVINDPSPDIINNNNNNIPSSDDFQRLSSFYYPLPLNEAHVFAKQPELSARPELMELSASSFYAPGEEYSRSSVTELPSAENFEFEKINPSDFKKNNATGGESVAPNTSDQQQSNNNQKFSKLLFSSPSATVTSNGPSGPFKAIICHDCDNSEGRNVGHSVSFSAIKSWNVGRSNGESGKLERDSNRSLTGDEKSRYDEQNRHEENQQIEMNDKVELFKVENVEMEKPQVPINTWNYSHLPINNEKLKAQKKPIFNDLLKVPYDVLNAPLTESPALEPAQGTQIHINHQQKFNDTITSNYHHFQQFIQKNLNKPNTMSHYQPTPMPEQNYEVEESVHLMTNGRVHGVQSTTERDIPHLDEKIAILPPEQEQDAKFGYVVEGRNFRKYRVEEKTADGFIVG